jgi:hypothetical protein
LVTIQDLGQKIETGRCARYRELEVLTAKKPGARPGSIKHDGYQQIVRRDGDRMRLFTRRGGEFLSLPAGKAISL